MSIEPMKTKPYHNKFWLHRQQGSQSRSTGSSKFDAENSTTTTPAVKKLRPPVNSQKSFLASALKSRSPLAIVQPSSIKRNSSRHHTPEQSWMLTASSKNANSQCPGAMLSPQSVSSRVAPNSVAATTATPTRFRTMPHHNLRAPLFASHKRNQWKTETKSANTLLQRLAQSTIGITHHRSRITEQPLQVDVVKINLESKLSEVSNGLDRTQNLNFYELDRELMEVNWEGLNAGHSRCKNPLHRMLDQHYFVPVNISDNSYHNLFN